MKENPKLKKLLLTILVLASTQIACGLGVPTPQSDQNQLNTMVAETMSALQLQQTATAVAQGEQGSQDAAAPPSVIPPDTATATVTPTETLTFTPTTPPDDPKLSLGKPDWEDHFDTAANWTLFDSSTTKTEVKNGRMLFTMYDTLNYSEWTVTWYKTENFYMEVTATTPNTCKGKDRYGLFFRAPDPSQGYIYTFSCDGSYRLSSWDGDTFNDLVKWSSSDHIISGAARATAWASGWMARTSAYMPTASCLPKHPMICLAERAVLGWPSLLLKPKTLLWPLMICFIGTWNSRSDQNTRYSDPGLIKYPQSLNKKSGFFNQKPDFNYQGIQEINRKNGT